MTLAALLAADPPDPAAIYAAALEAAPAGAAPAERRAYAAALAYWAGDGDPPPGAPINRALELWLQRVIDRADPADPAAALALIEALCFVPRPGSADADTIRAVVDLLDATRHTFKSRQIARAKALLQELIG